MFSTPRCVTRGCEALLNAAPFLPLIQAKGTAETLQSLGRQYGIDVHVLDLVGALPSSQETDASRAAAGRDTVSSSQIRAALEHGDIPAVERALDRPYQLMLSIPPADWPSPAATGWALRHAATVHCSLGSGTEMVWSHVVAPCMQVAEHSVQESAARRGIIQSSVVLTATR